MKNNEIFNELGEIREDLSKVIDDNTIKMIDPALSEELIKIYKKVCDLSIKTMAIEIIDKNK